MYAVDVVAKYIIMRCHKSDYMIDNFKLQKLLYFVQAEFLVVKNQPCFSERIEAWNIGPVVPDVYHRYEKYGMISIPYLEQNEVFPFSGEDCGLIDGIVDECAKYSTTALYKMTINQDPWKNAYYPFGCNSYRKMVISNESIKNFFKED